MYNVYAHFIDLSVTNKFAIGGSSNAPAYYTRDQYQLADDLDYIIGRHHIAFGFELLNFRMNTRNVSYGNGRVRFQRQSDERRHGRLPHRPAQQRDRRKLRRGSACASVCRPPFTCRTRSRSPRDSSVHLGIRWEPFLPEHERVRARQPISRWMRSPQGQKTSQYVNAPAGALSSPATRAFLQPYADSRYLDFCAAHGSGMGPHRQRKTGASARPTVSSMTRPSRI